MENNTNSPGAAWPMPKFHFSVDFGASLQNVSFQEVSGLETEPQMVAYRETKNPQFSAIKMPGIATYGNVTLKRGVFINDKNFQKWFGDLKMNTIQRQKVVIHLLDEKGTPTMTWTLNNAWPTKITSTDVNAQSSEIAIEEIILAHEGLTIENAGS